MSDNPTITFTNYKIQEKINGETMDIISWDGKIDDTWILGIHLPLKKNKEKEDPFMLFKEDGEKYPVTFKDSKVSLEIGAPTFTLYHGKLLRIHGHVLNPFKPIPVKWDSEGLEDVKKVYTAHHTR